MIGSGMQQGRKVTEEQTVEVVQNHEDGTQGGDRHSHPEGDDELRAAMHGAKRLREERTPGLVRWRGGSLDNPKRGNPALRPGRKDRNASGK
jgi:hypothetical protein